MFEKPEMIIFTICTIIIFSLVIILVIYFLNKRTEENFTPAQDELRETEIIKNTYVLNSNRKAEKDFYKAVTEYEKLIANISFDIVYQSKNEKIYCIDEHFWVYIGVNNWNGPSYPRPHILIEELSYNDVFPFNATKFGENFDNPFWDIRVNRFHGLKGKKAYEEMGVIKFFEIDKRFPEFKLLEQAEKWAGIPCHFIIVELYDENGSAATIKYLTHNNFEREARLFCRKLERLELYRDKINKIDHVKICDKLSVMHKTFLENQKSDKKLQWSLKGKLRYGFVSERTVDFDLQSRGKELLEMYENGNLHIEFCEYGRFEGKWKSEFLVFEICQKLYGKDNVIFQYTPNFLGHMSYDVYIISKNVAIEYQGKQHFEPVEFFGGQEHFEKQVVRDKLKLELSRKNKIKLVYINYNETISEDLIKERVEKSKIKT